MSKKIAELSPELVSVKGKAAPANDMPARAVSETAPEPAQDPLNFRVSSAFRREFKTYAAAHDMKLNELLVTCFESYRRQRGD